MQVKEVAMVVALSLLSAFFVGLLVDALYEEPKYDAYCKNSYRPYYEKPYPPDYQCPAYNLTSQEREQIRQCQEEGKGFPEFELDDRGCQQNYKNCNYCQKEHQDALAKYNRNVFFIVVPLGLVAILFGLFIGYEVVGSGMMFGGILLVAYGTMRYFSEMSKLMRVVVIFLELVILVIISIRKLKK